jgi:hypothetical protein
MSDLNPPDPVKSDPTQSDQDHKDELEKARRKHEKFLGIFLAAISGLFFTLCSVMVKLLKRIDPSEVLVKISVFKSIKFCSNFLLSCSNSSLN